MVADCFIIDPEGTVPRKVAYARFEEWCQRNKRQDLAITTPDRKFGEKLRAIPGLANLDWFQPHGQQRRWVGIRLRPRGQDRDDE